jgi:hypothetical protein
MHPWQSIPYDDPIWLYIWPLLPSNAYALFLIFAFFPLNKKFFLLSVLFWLYVDFSYVFL